MAKQMATRTQAKGCILLGTLIIQHLKTLVWWIADVKKCGITSAAADFTIDVMEQRCVLLGTLIIQHLKTLVWWIADVKKCGITPAAADFTIDVMEQADKEKFLRKEMAEKEPTIKDLSKI